MDLITGFLAEFFASTGLAVSTAIVLGVVGAVAVIILSVVLALGRRIDRLEERLMDLRQIHTTMQETQTDHAHVVSALGSIAGALPDLEEVKQSLRRAESQQSEVIGTVARVSIDLESMREVVATSFPKINTELVTLQESMDDYHSRLEIMQAPLTMLHSEQNKTYKVLKAWNSQLKDLREMVAALPSIEKEQAEVRNELTEWKSRFNAASEVLAEFLQSDGLPNERLPTSDAPTTQ